METDSAAYLQSPQAIRERSKLIFKYVSEGRSNHFTFVPDALSLAVDAVEAVTRKRYPSLEIPYHSRWRHFEGGNNPCRTYIESLLTDVRGRERLAAKIDLVCVSVLLDAGAGPVWNFTDPASGHVFSRSEGLAVASVRLAGAGLLNAAAVPLRADAEGLTAITETILSDAFQHTAANPLAGISGRTALLHNLGTVLRASETMLGQDNPRIADLVLYGIEGTEEIDAGELLTQLLHKFSAIWPGRYVLEGIHLGDVWRHSLGLVPFHKLSQWLTYSLVETFEQESIPVKRLELLTGLPEYRNGGLFIDTGVLELKDPSVLEQEHRVDSELVIEWRALTVCLLDTVANELRSRLQQPDLPLAAVLEGGTWMAGRELASSTRGGEPPLRIESDGTVF